VKHFSYLCDLSGIQFSDGKGWVQAFPVGTYQHPAYGEIKVDQARVMKFATNVNNKVRGTDLDIDYDHKKRSDEAAGWVKAAEARGDGLYLFVEWTPTAQRKLAEKAYRYFSPEYQDEWVDNQGVKHTDVLFGGALTNRPFLKNIQPVNLSEEMTKLLAASAPPVSPNGDANTRTDPQASSVQPLSVDDALGRMATALGLDPNADHNQILGAVTMLTKDEASEDDGTDTKEPGAGKDKETQMSDTDKDKGGGQPVALSEKQLMELPAYKAMAEQVKLLEVANKLSETRRTLTELGTGSKYCLSTAARELAETILLSAPKELSDKFVELLECLVKGTAVVELNELGAARNVVDDGAQNGKKQFSEAVDKAIETRKLNYADAVTAVATERPDLYAAYRESVLAGD
jgi:phage I-like protein